MEIFKESNNLITYVGNVEGKHYEVDYNKLSKVATIKVDGSVLSYEHYKRAIGKIYESAVKEIKDFKDIRFEFYPTNDKEFKNTNSVIKYFEIDGKSSVINKKDSMGRSIDEYFKANMVTKNENGYIKQYVERKEDRYGKEYVLEVSLDDMKEELNILLADDSINIDGLKDEEIANMVMDRLSERKKQYFMESSMAYEAKDEKEQAALNATGADDIVNTETGIVKKSPENTGNSGNSFRVVERGTDDKYNVVNPSVNEVSSVGDGTDGVDLTENEIESRDEEKVYYLDSNNGDIYNKDGEKIGNLSDGYRINPEDNSLSKDGQKLGMIDDINSMGKSIDKNKPKIRTLEKPDNMGIVDIKVLINIIILPLLIWTIFNWLTK